MNGPTGPNPPQRVPTLTEVVEWRGATATPPSAVAMPAAPGSSAPEAAPTSERVSASASITHEALVQSVLSDLQRQLDLMLEYRLREALAPLLARATDQLARDARNELASTLRDMVERAVAQELARHRDR
ncbi:MAG: hypothetical protein ABIP61_05100 [Burkholderiaceae bacterium]